MGQPACAGGGHQRPAGPSVGKPRRARRLPDRRPPSVPLPPAGGARRRSSSPGPAAYGASAPGTTDDRAVGVPTADGPGDQKPSTSDHQTPARSGCQLSSRRRPHPARPAGPAGTDRWRPKLKPHQEPDRAGRQSGRGPQPWPVGGCRPMRPRWRGRAWVGDPRPRATPPPAEWRSPTDGQAWPRRSVRPRPLSSTGSARGRCAGSCRGAESRSSVPPNREWYGRGRTSAPAPTVVHRQEVLRDRTAIPAPTSDRSDPSIPQPLTHGRANGKPSHRHLARPKWWLAATEPAGSGHGAEQRPPAAVQPIVEKEGAVPGGTPGAVEAEGRFRP